MKGGTKVAHSALQKGRKYVLVNGPTQANFLKVYFPKENNHNLERYELTYVRTLPARDDNTGIGNPENDFSWPLLFTVDKNGQSTGVIYFLDEQSDGDDLFNDLEGTSPNTFRAEQALEKRRKRKFIASKYSLGPKTEQDIGYEEDDKTTDF